MTGQADPAPALRHTSPGPELFNRAAKEMAGQLSELMADPHGPFRRRPAPGYMRGIDHYSAKELMPVVAAGACLHHQVLGSYPQLARPMRMTEKIFWSKLFRPMKVPEAGNKLLLGRLVPDEARPLLRIPEVVWRSSAPALPAADAIASGIYYLKTNHGSDMFRRIEWPPSDADRERLEREFAGHLRNDFGHMSGEWWYQKFRREIFLERSVTADPDSIAWYCYTFGERLARIVAFRKTAEGPQSFWMDPDFRPLERQSASKPRTQFALPSTAIRKRMVEAARTIGRRFSFVRVDFLIGDDKQLYLSELTFSPGNGRMRWPTEMDLEFGAMWNHERNPRV